MYLTPKQRRKNTITIIALLLGIPLTVFAAWQTVQLLSKASTEPVPQDVIISNVSTNSVSIGWVTEVSSDGAVVLVENGSDSSQVIDKRGTDKRKNHYVELTDLEPNSDYTFAIISGGERYESEGENSFTFVTAPISSSIPTPNPVYGDGGSFSQDDFVVYIINKSQSSYPVSVIPNASGGWAADLSGFRDGEDLSLVSVQDSDSLEVVVYSGLNEGDTVSGTFTELFDSKGQLRSIYSLSPEENTSLITSFSDFDTSTQDGDSSVDTDDTTSDDTDITDDTERSFRIVHDLSWEDLIKAGANLDIDLGEDSVLITNLRDTGFDVVWVSEDAEQGYVEYGEEEDSLDLEAKDIRDSLTVKDEYYTHYVEVDDLDPETTYYFDIHSGNDTYDGYNTTTFATLSSAPPIGSISGDISNAPSEEGVIVVGRITDEDDEGTSGNSQYASTISDSNGGWILSIADIRNSDGSTYFSYTDEDIIALDLLCYGESTTKEELMESIESRDIELAITASGDSVQYTKVPLLNDYSVLGIQIFSPVGNEDMEENISDSQDVLGVDTESVPNTGILDSVFGKIFLGLGCVIFGLGIWKSVDKKKKFNRL
jgi:hypothetical protein